MRKLVISLLIGSACLAQDAVVYEVPAKDARALKKAYDAMNFAEQNFESLRDHIAAKVVPDKAIKAINDVTIYPKLLFSKDFRFAVPDPHARTLKFQPVSPGITIPSDCPTSDQSEPPVKSNGIACADQNFQSVPCPTPQHFTVPDPPANWTPIRFDKDRSAR